MKSTLFAIRFYSQVQNPSKPQTNDNPLFGDPDRHYHSILNFTVKTINEIPNPTVSTKSELKFDNPIKLTKTPKTLIINKTHPTQRINPVSRRTHHRRATKN